MIHHRRAEREKGGERQSVNETRATCSLELAKQMVIVHVLCLFVACPFTAHLVLSLIFTNIHPLEIAAWKIEKIPQFVYMPR